MYNQVLVSVVIPCYRQERWLKDAIESVLASSWRKLEVVVVFDGSGGGGLVRRPNVRFVYQKNKGVCAARNLGISYARGAFVLPLDADDYIASDYLLKAMKAFHENPNLSVVSARYAHRIGGVSLCHGFSKRMFLCCNQIVVASLFRKSLWERVGGFSEAFSKLALEDWDFWLSIFEINPNFYVLPEVLIYYRQHEGSRNRCARDIYRRSVRLILRRHWRVYLCHPRELLDILGIFHVFVRCFRRVGLLPYILRLRAWQRAKGDSVRDHDYS